MVNNSNNINKIREERTPIFDKERTMTYAAADNSGLSG